MGNNSSANRYPDHPVERAYFEWVTRAEDALSGLWSSAGFQLPPEAQWEYTCRAGADTVFSFGDSASSQHANFDGVYPYGEAERGVGSGKTFPV